VDPAGRCAGGSRRDLGGTNARQPAPRQPGLVWLAETSDLPARLNALNRYAEAARCGGLPQLVAVDEAVTEPSPAAARSYLRRPPDGPGSTGRLADGYGAAGQPWFALTSASGKITWEHGEWLRLRPGGRSPHELSLPGARPSRIAAARSGRKSAAVRRTSGETRRLRRGSRAVTRPVRAGPDGHGKAAGVLTCSARNGAIKCSSLQAAAATTSGKACRRGAGYPARLRATWAIPRPQSVIWPAGTYPVSFFVP